MGQKTCMTWQKWTWKYITRSVSVRSDTWDRGLAWYGKHGPGHKKARSGLTPGLQGKDIGEPKNNTEKLQAKTTDYPKIKIN